MLDSSMIIGNFVNIDSPVHRLDARTKIIATLLYMVGIFFIDTLWGFALYAVLLVAAILAARLSVAKVFLSLKPLLFILALTFVIDLLFVRTGEPLLDLGFFAITEDGASLAVFMVLRLCLLFMGASLLTLCTSNVALTDAMESLLKPLRVFHVEPYEIAMVTSIALRFVPILLDEASKIKDAQLSRGASFESGGMMKRLRTYLSLFVPLFISSFRHAEELATAMEARCYRGGTGRTVFKEHSFALADYAVFAGMILLLATTIVLHIVL